MGLFLLAILITTADVIDGLCRHNHNERRCGYRGPIKVRFNPYNKTCEYYLPRCYHSKNSFNTMNECYEECKEFVKNPCVLPIKAIAEEGHLYSDKAQFRYGYDQGTGKCVKFLRSISDGNNNSFRTRKQCLETCAPNSLCLLRTEYHGWRFYTSYFYDFNHDTCNETSTFFKNVQYWPKENRFSTKGSCYEECMPNLYAILK